ncbi:MAG TPA: GDP-mannose 4,6-dehydratase [Mycobacterium sp.]|nr:GDP-mannose 4,6-dehydratase [Mycobacterium sp.]
MSGVGAGGAALITGATGQDGYYLSELLQRNGIEVHDVPRALLSEPSALAELITSRKADYVFHLAAISSVATSWQDPLATSRANALSTVAILDACLTGQDRTGKRITMVNASSGEIFAGAAESPRTESTPLQPISPYGASKAFSHLMCQAYRAKGLEVCNAILYSHESPRRPEDFVTRKITKAVAAIATGRQDRLVLGDMSIERDWGWAPDYVDAMFRMAVRGKGDDFIIATGVTHSVRDFVAAAFAAGGIAEWQAHVESDPALVRPREGSTNVGDPAKASAVLGWRATRGFDEIVKAMVSFDLRQEQDACGKNLRSRTHKTSPASSRSLLI